ncbi:GNAT family N-acetyltransferase [Paenibacillus glycanilyticus]|uniref:GNAT family N-acetyltransferase n=1 Tax=Paenibacillus glycanilyticus TaxID=126569 RepID=UPI00203AFBC8|nr:GNAT family N-acetyltransferase [Paenibacillus glycanilyticus]MCM3630016.1 GNAT family N-acetyltransferase [Paenibacillus glycanilyticus]
MELQLLTPEQWMSERKRLVDFAVRFGEKRLTVAAIHSLRSFAPDLLACGDSHTVIAVARHGKRIVGLGYAAEAGEKSCIIVTHPEARGLGIGFAVMEAIMKKLGRLTCQVALDNAPSLKLFFRLGMKAVSMSTGPTGKPTLRFEWTKEESMQPSASSVQHK